MPRRQNRVVNFANRQMSVKNAAIILAISTLVASVLGVVRDRLLNTYYLDTYPTGIDAYTVAFIIPDFMFSVLMSGALSVTFIPIFNQLRADRRSNDDSRAWDLASSMMNFMSLVGVVVSLLIVIFAEPLVNHIVAPNLSEASRALASSMMRIIAINPFVFSIAGVLASIQQATRRFVFYAISPMFYNIGIIIGTLFFTNGINLFGWQIFDGGIMGVALGVLLGSLLQLFTGALGVIGLGFDYKFKIDWKNQGFRKVLRIFPARSLDQGIDYFTSLIETRLASGMMPGTIRSYNQAFTLHNMPINLIGVSISNAAFASMTEKLALGQTGQFKKEVQKILRTIIWIAAPVCVITYFTRGYVVSIIKNGGDMLIANILGYLVLAVFCRAIYHILARTFYAKQDTKTPLFSSVISMIVDIVCAVFFIQKLGMGIEALAIAQTISAIVESGILLVVLIRQNRGLIDWSFVKGVCKIILVSLAVGVLTYLLVTILPLTVDDISFFSIFPKFGFICIVSITSYLALSYLLKMDEAKVIFRRLKKLLFNTLPKVNKPNSGKL